MATTIPVSEDTRVAQICYISYEKVDHLIVPNASGADYAQYDFVVASKFCGIADEAIANGASGSIHIEEGIQVQTSDLKTGELTFGTWGQNVYFDATNKKFSDTSTSGYYLVGYLTAVKDTNGMIVFEKTRYAAVVS